MKKIISLVAILCLVSCGGGSSVKTVQDNELSVEEGAVDWTPENFMKDHRDEWIVVKQAIDIQCEKDSINFAAIDSLVTGYISSKGIILPSDTGERIQKIGDICASRFDISDYDDSNMGMHIADGTERLFEMYVNWLYLQEAKKVSSEGGVIDIDKEIELYEAMNNAMSRICDSVAHRSEGSSAWICWSQIHRQSIDFAKYMGQAILGIVPDSGKELDVSLNMFDRECKALISNYKPYKEGDLKDVSNIVNAYKDEFHTWYSYRKSVASQLTDSRIKKSYKSITYSVARTHLLHLKNRYEDFGCMSMSMDEVCLDNDCSDKELLKFNFEQRYNELFGRL